MATTIRLTRNQRAQDAIVTADAAALTVQGMTIVIDDRAMERGDAARLLESAKEIILEGDWPRN